MVACILLVAIGYGWLGWIRQPVGSRMIRSAGMVASVSYPPDGRSRPIAGTITVKLENGRQASFSRPIRCMPSLKAGDRVEIVGRSTNAGGIAWAIVGEPCPT